jgi:putative hemolysin
VLAITYLTLVVGELVPKRLGLNNAEGVAARLAPFMRTLSRLASPLVRFLNLSTDLLLRLLDVRPGDEAPVSTEEISLLLEHGTRVCLSLANRRWSSRFSAWVMFPSRPS